ncbi:uncharacterized protein [Misgurnus anguillicaudatus]|uniref:uncharacterized protein isoform X1 n=1 Tax=Misgurnus anguillicaudatus TaxID=75329 RepID=UPI003CCFDDF8
MNKLLAVISLTAFLCYGVQSFDLSEKQLERQIINSGIAVFIDILEKVKNVTEKIVRENQFKKSRIAVQEHWKDLRQTVKQINDIDREKESLQHLKLSLSAGRTSVTMTREITEKLIRPYINIYDETFKTETMAGIWREVESEYLQGAPPINDKPLNFLSYLLAKTIVKSGIVDALKGGVNIVLEVEKIDLNQLHEEVQLLMNQVGEKAAEISTLERQKEKNDFLVSLRTASGLIVFYWDQILEHTESLSFHKKYIDSRKRWVELTQLKNSNEKYHVLIDPQTKHDILEWTNKTFGKLFEAVALKYYKHGNELFGYDRFNQSNWVFDKIATVYGLPVYEKLTESGFGISELNRLLHRINHAIVIIEGHDRSFYANQTSLEQLIRQIPFYISFYLEDLERKGTDDDILLPVKVIKAMVFHIWDNVLFLFNLGLSGKHEPQQSEREWNHMRKIFINELIKSGEFTEEELEEAPMNFLNATRGILEILNFGDLAEGFSERIDASALAFKEMIHYINMELHKTYPEEQR